MSHIMEGEALPTQIAAFLTALRMKGERPRNCGWPDHEGKAVRVARRTGGCGGHLRHRRDGQGTFKHFHRLAFVAAGGG